MSQPLLYFPIVIFLKIASQQVISGHEVNLPVPNDYQWDHCFGWCVACSSVKPHVSQVQLFNFGLKEDKVRISFHSNVLISPSLQNTFQWFHRSIIRTTFVSWTFKYTMQGGMLVLKKVPLLKPKFYPEKSYQWLPSTLHFVLERLRKILLSQTRFDFFETHPLSLKEIRTENSENHQLNMVVPSVCREECRSRTFEFEYLHR